MSGETLKFECQNKKLKQVNRDIILGGKGLNFSQEEFRETLIKRFRKFNWNKTNRCFLSGD